MSTDMKIRKFLLRNFQNGIPAYQTAVHISEKFKHKGYATRTCQRWFRKFREGDLDLNTRPSYDYQKKNRKSQATPSPSPTIRKDTPKLSKKIKSKAVPRREVEVQAVTFKRETGTGTPPLKNVVQQLIQRKREITLSKVEGGTVPLKELLAKANMITKRYSAPTERHLPVANIKSNGKKRASLNLVDQMKQHAPNRVSSKPKGRAADALEADLKLTPSMAKRMKSSLTSAESYSLGEGTKTDHKDGESGKKSITVQFQNVNPELAKNTVRKSSDASAGSLNGNKRLSTPQSTPLSSPKGVIYLNPQEIFRQSFGFQKNLQRQQPKKALSKPVSSPIRVNAPPPQPVMPLQASQSPVLVLESDSEDDLVFPEDVSVPPPKVKAVVDTFTTYWDMETGTPILLNPTQDVISTLPVIEID